MATGSHGQPRRMLAYVIGGCLGGIGGVAAGVAATFVALAGGPGGPGSMFLGPFILLFSVFWHSIAGFGLGLLVAEVFRSGRSDRRRLMVGTGAGMAGGFAVGLGLIWAINRVLATMHLSGSEHGDFLQLACLASLACVVTGALLGATRPDWLRAAGTFVSRRKRPVLAAVGIALVCVLPSWLYWRNLPAQKVPRLLRDRSPAALSGLGVDAVPALIDALGDRRDAYGRIRAAEQLGRLKDPRAVEPLISCLREMPVSVFSAFGALAEIRDSRAAEPLLDCLQDEDDDIRRLAALAAADVAGQRAFDPLVRILHDEKIKKSDAEKELRGTTSGGGLRATAAEALGRCGDARTFDVLLHILEDDDDDPQVRSRAARSLGKLGDRRAIPALTKVANAPPQPVRVDTQTGRAIGWAGAWDDLKREAKTASENLNRR